MKEIRLAATADVSNLFITGALLGGDVTGGNLRFEVDREGHDDHRAGRLRGRRLPARLAGELRPQGPLRSQHRRQRPVAPARGDCAGSSRRSSPRWRTGWRGRWPARRRSPSRASETSSSTPTSMQPTRPCASRPSAGRRTAPGAASSSLPGGLAGERLVEISRASISAPGPGGAGLGRVRPPTASLKRVIVDRLISGKTDASAIVTADAGDRAGTSPSAATASICIRSCSSRRMAAPTTEARRRRADGARQLHPVRRPRSAVAGAAGTHPGGQRHGRAQPRGLRTGAGRGRSSARPPHQPSRSAPAAPGGAELADPRRGRRRGAAGARHLSRHQRRQADGERQVRRQRRGSRRPGRHAEDQGLPPGPRADHRADPQRHGAHRHPRRPARRGHQLHRAGRALRASRRRPLPQRGADARQRHRA